MMFILQDELQWKNKFIRCVCVCGEGRGVGVVLLNGAFTLFAAPSNARLKLFTLWIYADFSNSLLNVHFF